MIKINEEVKEVETKKEFDLKEAFILWKNKSKAGQDYLKGHTPDSINIVGYFNTNKKNPKEPDIRCYIINGEGKQDKEIASLWDNVSKTGMEYLSGSTEDNEKLIAFYSKKEDEKAPFIRVYYK